MLNFKKEIEYLLQLVRINQIPIQKQVEETVKIEDDVKQIYEALLKKADSFDYTGVSSLTIKNNMIKWSE